MCSTQLTTCAHARQRTYSTHLLYVTRQSSVTLPAVASSL